MTSRILVFMFCWLAFSPLAPAQEKTIAELEKLLPAVGAKRIEDRADAQQTWESICYQLGRPGREDREAVCIAMGDMLSQPRTRAAAKIFILRMLERIGRDEAVPAITSMLDAERAGIREAARRALANNPSAEASNSLVKRFDNATAAQEQRAILNAIGYRAEPASIGFLMRVIRDSNGAVRESAIATLGNIAGVSIPPNELKKGQDRDAQLRAADQLAESGETERALTIYNSILADPMSNSAFRMAAFRGKLQSLVDERDVVAVIRHALVEEQRKPFLQIAVARIRSLSSEGMRLFAGQLQSLPARAQVTALSALGTQRNPAPVSAVTKLLMSSTPEVQDAAIEALGGIGDASTLDQLFPLVKAGDTQGELATNSLKRIRDPELDELLIGKLKSTSDSKLRQILIEILNARRAVEAVPVLLTEAASDDPDVRQLAIAALSRLAQAADIPAMLVALDKAEGAERDKAERHIVNLCRRLPEGAASVVGYFEAASSEQMLRLMPLLGRIGGDSALAAIRNALHSGDAEQYAAGVSAMSNWPDASVASDLRRIASDTQDRGQKIRVQRALARVAVLGGSDAEKLAYLRFVMNSAVRNEERELALDRAKAVRTLDSLEFVLPFIADEELGKRARRTVVDLAHHRGLREPNRSVFEPALRKVLAITNDARLAERAEKYLANE